MIIDTNLTEGIFIRELNNRFVCEVMINNKIYECYVPSSVKLNKYLKLENRKVLLAKNKTTNRRTQYSLFAVSYYNKYIIVNLSMANKLIEEYLNKNEFNGNTLIFREKTINGYKADFVLQKELTEIIEVKSVLGTRRIVTFPNIYSDRMISQLEKISQLLDNNFIVKFYIVSLSPIVREVIINKNEFDFYTLFKKCINKGLIVQGFSLHPTTAELYLKHNLKIIFD